MHVRECVCCQRECVCVCMYMCIRVVRVCVCGGGGGTSLSIGSPILSSISGHTLTTTRHASSTTILAPPSTSAVGSQLS